MEQENNTTPGRERLRAAAMQIHAARMQAQNLPPPCPTVEGSPNKFASPLIRQQSASALQPSSSPPPKFGGFPSPQQPQQQEQQQQQQGRFPPPRPGLGMVRQASFSEQDSYSRHQRRVSFETEQLMGRLADDHNRGKPVTDRERDIQELRAFLRSINCLDVAAQLEWHNITLATLKHATDEDLVRMDIPLAQRVKIMESLHLAHPRQQAHNFAQGLALGVEEVGHGLVQGLTSIIESPVVGAQENGVSGALVGFGKGLVDVVKMPVLGTIYGAEKVVEGAKSSSFFG